MRAPTPDKFLRYIVSGPFWGNTPKRAGVAVSGGSDSMALLDLMAYWTREEGIELLAVTVDHGLRVEAKEEAKFVAAFCAERGISHDILNWGKWDGTGNLQAMARDARYRLIADWAREAHVDAVALGHTANDQAETFLMRLARASGVDGLSAMERSFTRNGVRFVRPVLEQTRQELRDYLHRQEMSWIEDPSNSDRRFDRVKAREALEQLEPLGITIETLTATTFSMSMARSALDFYTQQQAGQFIVEDRGDLILTRGPELHPEIHRRLVNKALQFIGGATYPPRTSSLAEMDYGLGQSGTHTLGGCLITKDGLSLRFTRELNAVSTVVSPTELPWDRRWLFEGPHEPGLEVRALGEYGLQQCPNWRGTEMPRASLLASPGIWRGDVVEAAPIAGPANGWQTKAARFQDFLIGNGA